MLKFTGMIGALAAAVVSISVVPDVRAQQISSELASRLTNAQARSYIFYLRAQAQYDRDRESYWSVVEELREKRRHKRSARRPFTPEDFVAVQPPKYAGPSMPSDVARIIASLKPKTEAEPERETRGIATVDEALDHARKVYGFVPERTTEAEFKRRYAAEALSLGLSKDQVVRVYALETGGRGTYDMQAGIDPQTKRGRPISTALGYAQLLCANSINEVVKHGDDFARRLRALATAASGTRRSALLAKALAVKRMRRAATSVPNRWSAHVAFSRTPRGLGIHALNLDADIGPWLQTIKLRDVKNYAVRAGRPRLSGAEIELMNLAGPRTGLDMMDPVGREMPTSNFFAENAYNRNSIVRDKTGAELLTALDNRMVENLRVAGSIEFARIFDVEIARRMRAARR